MSECNELRELAFNRDPTDDARVWRHAARCPHCREQSEVDRELRQLFQGITAPVPSLDFNRKLRQRLRVERSRQRDYRRRLVVMQGYWIFAGLASVLVMMLTHWPNQLPSPLVLCSGGSVLVVALLTPLILFLSLGTDPLRLILGTLDGFRR